MTDMRATERLLEFIVERSDDKGVKAAAVELQRRGAILVRCDDLRLALGAASQGREYGPSADYARFDAAIGRLENAIGGR